MSDAYAADWVRHVASISTVIGSPRRFVADGQRWVVVELVTGGARAPCLVFMCDYAIRRVSGYPAGWEVLSDEDLFAASWGR
jgi:hypothetical protein